MTISAVVVPSVDLAGRLVSILLAQDGLNVLDRESVAVQQSGVDFHANGRTGASANRHLPDTLKSAKASAP